MSEPAQSITVGGWLILSLPFALGAVSIVLARWATRIRPARFYRGGMAPGWYADPRHGNLLRYWDGWRWTPEVASRPRAASRFPGSG